MSGKKRMDGIGDEEFGLEIVIRCKVGGKARRFATEICRGKFTSGGRETALKDIGQLRRRMAEVQREVEDHIRKAAGLPPLDGGPIPVFALEL